MELEAVDFIIASCDLEFKCTTMVETGRDLLLSTILERIQEVLGIAGSEHLLSYIAERKDTVHVLLCDDYGAEFSFDFEMDDTFLGENDLDMNEVSLVVNRIGMSIAMFNEKRRIKLEEERN